MALLVFLEPTPQRAFRIALLMPAPKFGHGLLRRVFGVGPLSAPGEKGLHENRLEHANDFYEGMLSYSLIRARELTEERGEGLCFAHGSFFHSSEQSSSLSC